MLINYLQPVVKETLKGWLLSPEGGGGGGGRRAFPGLYREASPERCTFFRLEGDGRFTTTIFSATKRCVALRCVDMKSCNFVPTLKPYQKQQSYSGLRSPGGSYLTYLWNDPWVQAFNIYTLCCAENRHCKFLTLPSGLWLAQGSLALHKK